MTNKVKTEKQIIQSQKRRIRRSRLNHKLNHADMIMSKDFRNLRKAIMNTAKPVKDKYKNDAIPSVVTEWR